MKIGIVLPSLPAYSEIFFMNKIYGLVQSGHSVFLFINAHTSQKEFQGARVITTQPPNTFSFIFYWDVLLKLIYLLLFRFKTLSRYWILLKKEGYTFRSRCKLLIINRNLLLFSMDWIHYGFGTMAIDRELVPKAIGAKMAVSFRGFDIAIFPLSHPKCYEKVWKHTDKIHVISNDLQKKVLALGGQESSDKCVKISPAINIDFFKRTTSLSNFNTPYQFITVARLHWKKGFEYTLKALSLLKKEGLLFHYTIIGSGVDAERLQFVTHLLGLEKQVTFTGRLSHNAIKNYLEKTHVYIQYSIQEGFCNAVLEAQAMGVFCVVSDAEGLSENVVDGISGYVVARRKPIQLMLAIKKYLLTRKEQKDTEELFAYQRIKRDFSLEGQIEKFNNFYT